MDGEYIKVDRLVAFIKQNGYVYANSLYEMGEDAVSREEYNRVLKQRDIAVKYLNNLRLATNNICYACANDRFDYDKSSCLGCEYNNNLNWEVEFDPETRGCELCTHPDEPCLFRVYGAKEGYCGTNECEHARKLKKMEEAT